MGILPGKPDDGQDSGARKPKRHEGRISEGNDDQQETEDGEQARSLKSYSGITKRGK